MSASPNLNKAGISSLAERIVQARRLYGADSSYIIGLFAGIDLLLVGGEEAESVRRQIRDRVVEIESGKSPASPSTHEASKGRGDASALAENTWIRGSVKWFNNDKGYGFISTDSDTDVFVHWRDISSWDRGLTQGDEVEFMVTKTAKGFQAINVMKGDREGQASEDGATPRPDEEGGTGDAAPAAAEEIDAPAANEDARSEVEAESSEDAPAPDGGGRPAAEGANEPPTSESEVQTQPENAS